MRTRPLLYALTLTLLALPAGCGGDDDGDGTGPEAPQAIQSGTWSATAEFGTFTFTVASGGAAIEELSFTFASWKCGSASAMTSGTVTQSRSPGWSIGNRAVSISVDFDPFGNSQTINLTGTFQDNGTSASGSWSAAWNGGNCSGSWQASK
jgi:hypothetical protein